MTDGLSSPALARLCGVAWLLGAWVARNGVRQPLERRSVSTNRTRWRRRRRHAGPVMRTHFPRGVTLGNAD